MAGSQILYARTPFKLVRRPDRANLEIIWRIDGTPGKESAGTADEKLGRDKLDKLYSEMIGGGCDICPTCKQAVRRKGDDVLTIIDDYWTDHGQDQKTAETIKGKLDYVRRFLATIGRPVQPDELNEKWIEKYRAWMRTQTFATGGIKAQAKINRYAPGTIEGGVLQLKAALKWAKVDVQFEIGDLVELSASPEFRLDIDGLAKIFRYALANQRRKNLLAYMRLAIATWGRPENILELDLSPGLKQWSSHAKALRLNPIGRKQTKKRRPSVPVPDCVADWIDTLPQGPVFETELSRKTWERMEESLGLPGDGQSGMKLIRRSISDIARDRLDPSGDWHQGEKMLGHVGFAMSDLYALRRPSHLGKALAVTEAIIAEIEAACPGAFIDQDAPRASNIVRLVA